MSRLKIQEEKESIQVEEIKKLDIEDEESKKQLILNKKLITLLLKNKDESIISQYIETSGVDINYFNNEYNPLFQILKTYQKDEKILLKLLNILSKFHVNYNIIWKDNNTPLFEFLTLETDICCKLLKLAKENGANIYQLDLKKRNLLMCAIELKVNFKVVKYLFSLNFNLGQQDIDGNTVYNYATISFNINSNNKVLPYLLKNYIYDTDVIIRLIIMGKNKQPTSKQNIINVIKNDNKLINIKNNDGNNPLFISIRSYRPLKILSYLMQLGSHINEVDNNGSSPLIIAAESRNYKAFYYLMQFHPDINLKNKNNDTALIMAAKNNYINMVNLLLNFCEVKKGELKKAKTIISIITSNSHSSSLNDFEDEDTLNVKNLDNTKNLKVNEQNNDGETALSLAIKNENKEMVYNLLTCGADPSIMNNKKETALINAVQINNERIVDLILNAQDNINGVDENHDTAMIIAVRNGNYEIVKKLVKRNADITIRDKDHNTPLMIAIRSKENIPIIKIILSQPNNTLHYRDKNGKTAFLLSIENYFLGVTKLLLEFGASLSDLDSKKNNALMIACKFGKEEMVHYLIENKSIDLNAQNANLNTALIKACKYSYNSTTVAILLNEKNNCNLEIKNNKGNTALLVACLNKNIDIAKHLLNHNANVEVINNENVTPFVIACQNNDIAMANMLINSYKCKVNYDDPITQEKMSDCFINAVENGQQQLVLLLLNNGYKINISNRNNGFYKLLSALITATNNAYYKILDEILSKPYFSEILKEFRQTTVLITACKLLKKKTIELLINYQIDVNVRDDHNNTALIEASNYPYLFNNIKTFIKLNANVNVINDEGTSALLNSCKLADNKIFKLLVNKGANIYITDNQGNNALMYACSNNDIYKIRYLLKKGINIDTQNSDGETALMQSVRARNDNIVKFLLKYKASINILNKKNQSALTIGFITLYDQEVVNYKDLSVIKVLISKNADPNIPIDAIGNSVLMFLIMKNDISMIKYFLKKYSKVLDFNHKNNLGHNAFTYALKCKNNDIINLLISTNKFDVLNEDDYGNDMLMYITCSLSLSSFRIFSAHIEDTVINKCNHNRESYLIMATKVNNEKIIDILLDKGIDVDHQESQGNTALHYAALQDNMATIEKLIKYGANLEIQNYKGETPLMVACRFKQQNAIKTLLDNGAQSLFVDNVIYSKEKSFDFKQNQDLYIEMMIEYYNDISAIVPDNYMSNITLLNRMKVFYEPVSIKDRIENMEEYIKDGLEEIFEFCVDAITGNDD
ncbi:ankyrin [Piromyces finnis]|uniref:Ankyrin n=1 Tax=Piromyces finnis TaxID=1754191 RepID=A0A1Y1VP30_9FUNG|nr:ankyrin [Piromyces finnis]|eukprot:ORX61169.1 ankyrin [Piromyces finnis]